jgi:hypothetical protein
VAAEGRLSMAWRHDGATETAWVLFVSPNYFSMVTADVIAGQLRVEPMPGGSPSVVIYLGVARAQIAIVIVACISPALRAARVDPLIALPAD